MHLHLTAFENIVGKEEIAHYEQISSFPTIFSTQSENSILFVNMFDIISLFAAELAEPKIGMLGKGLTDILPITFSFLITQYQFLSTLKKKAMKNMGKGINACNQHFLLFQPCFSTPT